MNQWYVIYLIAFLAGTAATLALTPPVRKLAEVLDFMDRPAANHKGHRRPTPLLGGLVLFFGWSGGIVAGIIAARLGWVPDFRDTIFVHLEGLALASRQLGFIAGAAAGAVILGLADDKFALPASAKFIGQFAVAAIAVAGGGVRIQLCPELDGISWAVTVLWIMLMMNSINFFDNMDGLAVGVIAIAMFFFTVISALNHQYFVAVLAALSCGVCCGFWFYNANPATIFMGDSGSHFLGFITAVVATQVTYYHAENASRLSLLVPLFILALPLFDTVMVVAIRTLNRKPFWIGDHNHISHRFVRLGMSRRTAVLVVHLLALTIALATLPIYWGEPRTAIVLTIQALLLIAVITVLQFTLSHSAETREK